MVFITLSILSCNEDLSGKNANSKSYKKLLIEINSPYSCYNQIELNNNSSGTALGGYIDTAGQNKIIKSKKDFIIRHDSDIIKISDLIDQMRLRPLVLSARGYDLYHFVFTIDGKKLVDKYGQDSSLDNVLRILAPYVRNEKSGQCDFFNLFK